MSILKNIIINDKYKIKHFIDSSEFCEIYSANELSSNKLVLFNVYNAAKISRDDLDENDDLREIGPTFLLLGPRVWEQIAAEIRSKIMDSSYIKRKLFNFFTNLKLRYCHNFKQSIVF